MTPGPLGFYWTAALIQAIKVVVTFVLKKKTEGKRSSVSLCGAFFLLSFQRAGALTTATACAALRLLCFISVENTRKAGKVAESGFPAVEAHRPKSAESAAAADSRAPASLKIRGPDNLSADLWRARAASANQLMRRKRASSFTCL